MATATGDRRERRREHLLEAASGMFAARGYHGVSMDELATGSAISKPGLYAYFPSKEELYVAVLRRYSERLTAAIADAVVGAEPAEAQLWAGIQAFAGYVDENRDQWLLLFRDATGAGVGAVEEVRASRARLVGALTDLFERALSGADLGPGPSAAVEPLVHAFVGSVEGIVRWWMDNPEVPRGSVEMYLMNVAWQGFGDLLEGRLWLPGVTE